MEFKFNLKGGEKGTEMDVGAIKRDILVNKKVL